MMIPILTFILGANYVPTILAVNSLVSVPYRFTLFFREINWPIARHLIFGSLIGGSLGAYSFSILNPNILYLVIGLFLVAYPLLSFAVKKELPFAVENWHFAVASIVTSYLSGLLGAVGPIMNSLYLKRKLSKEELIGTKTANIFVLQIVKLSVYSATSSIQTDMVIYGLYAGLGGIIGITIGKRFLTKISDKQFKNIVLGLMFFSGIVILAKALA